MSDQQVKDLLLKAKEALAALAYTSNNRGSQRFAFAVVDKINKFLKEREKNV